MDKTPTPILEDTHVIWKSSLGNTIIGGWPQKTLVEKISGPEQRIGWRHTDAK
jgi:hypothetical protein